MSVDYVAATDPTAAAPPTGTKVAADGVGGVAFQLVKLAKGNAGSATPITGADPLPVYQASNYDSGLLSVPAVDTLVTAASVRVTGIFISNLTDLVQLLQLTDNQGSPVAYLKNYELAPRQPIFVPLGGVLAAGLRWSCGNAAALNAQIVGNV